MGFPRAFSKKSCARHVPLCLFCRLIVKFSTFLSSLVDQAKVPTDIPASVLNKTSEVIDAQLGYVKQLGTYIKTSLKV